MSLAICEPYPAENKVKVLYSQKAGCYDVSKRLASQLLSSYRLTQALSIESFLLTGCRKMPDRQNSRRQKSTSGRRRKEDDAAKQKSTHHRRRSSSRKRQPSTSERRSKSRGRKKTQSRDTRKSARTDVRSRSKSQPRTGVGSKSKSARTEITKPQDASSSRSQKSRSGRNSQGGRKRSSGAKGRRAVGPNKTPSAKRRSHFAEEANKAIPALVTMISGCHDAQTSADVANLSSQFKLPNPAGKSGGACTAALLEVLHCSSSDDEREMSWVDVLRRMRIVLNKKGFDQCPQLTCSRMINVKDRFFITPPDFNEVNNTKRAVLIGINYTGTPGELRGCHNDCLNVARFLREQGFRDENVTMLLDDNKHRSPTKAAILSAYKKLVRESKPGDVVFCHYSGHGGRLPDDNGDEDDGWDETLIPVDFKTAGQIRDDDLFKFLVHPMPANVTMTCLMDCCHSGTVLDLPYRFTADGDLDEMQINDRCDFKSALYHGLVLGAGLAVGDVVASTVISGAVNAFTKPSDLDTAGMVLGGGHAMDSDIDCCNIL